MVITRKSLTPIDFDGLRIFDYTADQDCGLSLAFIEVPPGAAHAEAWSKRSDKYYFVTHGELHFRLDGEALDLRSGDYCMVQCGQHFSYSNPSSEITTLILVHNPRFSLEDEVFVVSE